MRAMYESEDAVDWDEVYTRDEAAKILDCSVDRVRTTLGESARALPLDVIKRYKTSSLWWRDKVMEAARMRGRICVVCDENVVGMKGGKTCRSPRCKKEYRARKPGKTEHDRRMDEQDPHLGATTIIVGGKTRTLASGTTLSRASTRAEVYAAMRRAPGEGLTMDRVFSVAVKTGLPPAQVLSIARSYGRGVF